MIRALGLCLFLSCIVRVTSVAAEPIRLMVYPSVDDAITGPEIGSVDIILVGQAVPTETLDEVNGLSATGSPSVFFAPSVEAGLTVAANPESIEILNVHDVSELAPFFEESPVLLLFAPVATREVFGVLYADFSDSSLEFADIQASEVQSWMADRAVPIFLVGQTRTLSSPSSEFWFEDEELVYRLIHDCVVNGVALADGSMARNVFATGDAIRWHVEVTDLTGDVVDELNTPPFWTTAHTHALIEIDQQHIDRQRCFADSVDWPVQR